jgi:hypothetical protein
LAPDTTIDTKPSDPSTSSSASFTFNGTDAGTGVASFECKLDAGSFSACTSPKSYSGLSDASHTFDVRAIDGVDNVDPSPASYTWTIDTTPVATSGVVINELRGSGTAANDDYVELFNRGSTSVNMSGWRLDARAGDDTAAGSVTLPAQTIAPRGKLLVAAPGYSLAALATSNDALGGELPAGGSVALIDPSDATQDAVRFAAGTIFGEGGPLGTFAAGGQYAFVRKANRTGTGDAYGLPTDTNNNAADFALVVPQGGTSSAGSALPSMEGVPGPENLSSAPLANAALQIGVLDSTVGSGVAPNRQIVDPDGAGPLPQTLYLRRKLTNISGNQLAAVGFRVSTITTARSDPQAGQSVIRLDSSDNTTVAGKAITPVSLQRSVQTPLPNGGGLNAVVTVPSITPIAPLAPGASVNVEFALRIAQSGAFQVILNTEARRVDEAPALANIEAGALAYSENDPATPITAAATVTDVDSADFDTGALTVDYSAGGQPEDRLAIRDQGTGAGQIGVSGSTVSFGGTTIGTFSGGTGTNSLVVTFDEDATPAAVQALIRNVTYRNVSENPSTTARTARFVLTDGDGGTSAPATRDVAVTAVPDAPVITTTAGSLPHVEGDGPESIDPGLTITDADSPNIASATVQLTGNYANPEDVLAVAPLFSVTPSFDASTGKLTLTGATTIANYQTILRAVTYEDTSQAPSILARTVTFKADDGSVESAGATKGITVTGVDDAPTVTTSAGSTGYTEQAAAVTVDSALVLADVDGGNATGATVEVLSPVTGDTLAFTNQNNITGSFAAGVLTLSGSATLAQYQAALRSVQFSNAASDTPGTSRSIRFKLTTPVASNTSTKALAITEVNDPPVVNLDAAGALSYPEQNGFTNVFGPAATITDVDSTTLDSLTVTVSSGFDAAFDTLELNTAGFTANFAGGALTITKAGGTLAEFTTALRNVRYRNTDDDPDDRNDGTPNASAAQRTLSAVADDGPANSTPATRDVTITPVNDAPSAPTPAPSANGVRNTTLVSGTNSVTGPKVTRTIDLKGNSTDPDGLESAIVVQSVSNAATAQGGRITLTSPGDLRYEPPASITLTTDTYGYQLSDGTNSSPTTTFTVNLSGEVWYVADQAPAPRDGTSARPFDTLSAALAVATTNDAIHIRGATGDGNLTGGVTLQSGQKLLGEGVALTGTDVGASGAPGTLFAAGTKPVLTASGVDVVTLANSTEVAGLSINPDGAGGGLAGTNPTGVSVRDIDITDSLTQATQPGIELTTGGGLTFSGSVFITTTAARALDLTGTALSGTLSSTTVTGGTNGGVSLTNTTGGLTFRALSLTTSGGTGFRLNNAANVDVDGTNFATSVTSTGGPAVDATTLTNGTDLAFDAITTSGTPTKGVNLDGSGGWTFSAGSGSAVGATSQVGFDVNGGSGAVSYAGSIANGTGRPVDITGRTGDTTVSGNITGTGGTGINVSGNTAGTTTFSGATKTLNTGASQAVTLSSNTGHTITFTGGGLDIDTTSATGFGATGGGTIAVTGTGNSATATTGSALSVANTTIGASDLNFQSISSSGGSATGIILNTTGTTGGLTVTGDGTNTTRGGNGSGGTIANKSGADGATTTGNAIYLNSAAQVTLRRMTINGTNGNHGILATNSREIALEFSTVNGANGNNAFGGLEEGSITFLGLTVSGSIADSIVGGGFTNNLRLVNTSGSLNRLTISNSTFDQTGSASSNNNLLIEAQNAGTVLNFTMQGSTIRGARADWVSATNNSSSSMDAVISGNTFSNLGTSANPNAAPGGNRLVVGSIGTLTYNIDGNTLNGSNGEAILARGSGAAASGITGTATGRITNNLIGTAATANSGSREGSGIDIFGDGGSDNTTLISGNTIRQYNNHAIVVTFGDEIINGAVNNVTVTNNNANTPGNLNTDFNGFHLNSGTVAATDDFTSCLELANNNFTGAGQGVNAPNNGDIRLRQRQGTTVRLPGYGGPARDNSDNQVAEIVTFMRPPASGGVKSNVFGTGFAGSVSTGGGYIGTGGACVTPP